MRLTLAQYRKRFWSETGLPEEEAPIPRVDDLLNLGWAKAAEDTGGVAELIGRNSVADQEEYNLPDRVLEVRRVMIKDSSDNTIANPKRAPMVSLVEDKDTVDSGIPCWWAWGYRDYDNSVPKKVLRLRPAYNTVVTRGIQIDALVVPDPVTADNGYPTVPDELAEAGFYWACALGVRKDAQLAESFRRDYHYSVGTWNRRNPENRIRHTSKLHYGGRDPLAGINSLARGG